MEHKITGSYMGGDICHVFILSPSEVDNVFGADQARIDALLADSRPWVNAVGIASLAYYSAKDGYNEDGGAWTRFKDLVRLSSPSREDWKNALAVRTPRRYYRRGLFHLLGWVHFRLQDIVRKELERT